MSCADFIELVTAFLDGAMDEDTERRFIGHLSDCHGCETYLAQIMEVRDVLCDLPSASISGSARDELLNAFRDWST
jgi:anti-sigma factor RsiW